MSMFRDLFMGSSISTAIIYISLTAFLGVLLGKLKIGSVKLGIAGVLFVGLFFGHLGAHIDPNVLGFVKEFGLILFVYAVGIEVGPKFFSSFRKTGIKMNLMACAIVFLGFLVAYILYLTTNVSGADITGIMCGAVTNTPGLGAAQQLLVEQQVNGAEMANKIGMGYAVAYPFGVIGVIVSMMLIKLFFRVKVDKEISNFQNDLDEKHEKLENVSIALGNKNLIGEKLSYIYEMIDKELVISRIERRGNYLAANDDIVLEEGDVIHGISSPKAIGHLKLMIGDVEVQEKKAVTGSLAMYHVLVTNRKIAGKTVEQIGIYRRYEANITRIFRSGMEILPTRHTTVELGDTVRIVGKRDLLEQVKAEIGNSVKELSKPNIIPIFIGIFLGIVLGSIPIFIPGLPAPAKLGFAGGPLIIAILLGYKGRTKKGNISFYITPGANMMLRELGIVLFLACVGLSSGGQFVETIVNGGYMWMVYGALITFIPVFLVGMVGKLMGMNYLSICGVMAGAMTDPPALEYANTLAPIEAQSTSYATVYPLTMFLRVLLAQLLILITLT